MIKFLKIVLLFLILIFITDCTDTISGFSTAEKGVFNLSGIQKSNENFFIPGGGLVKLDGEWEFYWNQFIDPLSFSLESSTSNSDVQYVSFPSKWQDYGYPDFGFASYRLKVLLDKEYHRNLGLFIPESGLAYSLYINGTLYSSNGKPGKSKEEMEPYQQFKYILVKDIDSNELNIVIHVSNFHSRKSGFYDSIEIGTASRVESLQRFTRLVDAIGFGSLMVMAIYHLGLFILRKKDRSPFYFSLFCLLLALQIMLIKERAVLDFFPFIGFLTVHRLDVLTHYLAQPVFSLFLYSIFPEEFSKKILSGIIYISIPASLLVVFSSFYIYTSIIHIIHLVALYLAIYSLWITLRAYVKKRLGSKVLLIGYFLFVTCAVNDILNDADLINTTLLSSYGSMIFVFSQSFVLSLRSSEAYIKNEKLVEEIHQKEQEYTSLVSNINLGVYRNTSGRYGRFISANPAIAAMFGYDSVEEFMKMHVSSLYADPEERKKFVDMVSRTGECKDYVLHLKKKDGTLFWASLNAKAKYDSMGNLLWLDGVIEDITQRIDSHNYIIHYTKEVTELKDKLEVKVKERTADLEKFKAVADYNTASIIITNIRGFIEYANESYLRITGYSREEVLGKKSGFIKSGLTDSAVYESLWNTIRYGKGWNGKLQNVRKNGEFYWEEISISPVFNERGELTHYVGIMNDITDKHKAEEELNKANEQLATLDKEKTSFFQNISHELRTPLILIAGPVESAKRKQEPLSEKAMDMVLANTRRLQRLVNQLLDLQKITAGKMTVDFRVLNLNLILKSTIQAFHEFCAYRNINLVDSVEENLPLARADFDKLDKCIYNYLSNALKFTPEGGSIILRAESRVTHILVEVIDTGKGISSDKLNGLFTKFGYSESSLTREQEGTGLGLSLVKELIELQGGEVGVDSIPGQGSRFWFTVPLAPMDSEEEFIPEENLRSLGKLELGAISYKNESGVNEDLSIRTNDKYPEKTILVIEDNHDLRSYISNIFMSEGCNVIPAENGEEGIKIISGKKLPDLIVTDLMMPKVSGLDFIKFIKADEHLKSIPVILLTARADIETRIDVHEAGADGYLSKPFNEAELLACVRNLFNLKARELSLLKDIEKARNILHGLLPEKIPERKGMKFSVLYEPMDIVGGDLYDFLELSGERIGIFVADVSGHGLPAAMISSIGKIVLSMLGPDVNSPADLLEKLNEQLYGKTANNFMTAWYGILDPINKKITYASAGHPPALLVRNDSYIFLKNHGSALGVFNARKYENKEVEILSGDRFVIYSDGIVETAKADEEMFGEERFIHVFLNNKNLSIADQLNLALREAKVFNGEHPFEDDITVVGIAVD